MEKLNIEFIRAEFKKEGYELLTKVYENAHQKLDYICSKGHKYSISWSNWKKGARCPRCSVIKIGKKLSHNIEFIRAEFAKENYTLLTKTYKNNLQKLKYVCSRGHKHSISWANWSQGYRCPMCAGVKKCTIGFVKSEFRKKGYKLLTKTYENAFQKLNYICPRGHRHFVSWNRWQQRQRCPFCNNTGISKWEKIVKNFLVGLNVDYIPNDRTQLINPNTNHNLELDMWMPQLNKAIECNGDYWHTKRQVVKNDKIKQQLCKDQGIDLLVITDKEWDDNIDKCKNKIQEFLC